MTLKTSAAASAAGAVESLPAPTLEPLAITGAGATDGADVPVPPFVSGWKQPEVTDTFRWKPSKPGEAIAGAVLSMRASPLGSLAVKLGVAIDATQSVKVLWYANQAAEEQIAALKVRTGDGLAVQYIGEQDTGKPNAMPVYRVWKR